jgi:hypothetical protein
MFIALIKSLPNMPVGFRALVNLCCRNLLRMCMAGTPHPKGI